MTMTDFKPAHFNRPADAGVAVIMLRRPQRKNPITFESYAEPLEQAIESEAQQIHGGDGVRVGHPVASLYRKIRALCIYEGASDVQKVVIARSIVGAAAGR